MPKKQILIMGLLFLFALSFTFFAIQSGDVLMYLTLARDYFAKSGWPSADPYLYSLPHAEFHVQHEYLSYFLFYAAWWVFGFSGLILLKMLILSVIFALALRHEPRAYSESPLWIALWLLAVLAASFRFIERASLFSDLFTVLLIYWLLEYREISKGLVIRLTLLFLFWIQLHPGFPVGLAILTLWVLWHRPRSLQWLMIPMLVLLINPLGVDGLLYPFRFAFHESAVLKLHNFEWFPTYHQAFRFTPEVIAFWGLLIATGFLLYREKAWLSFRGGLALLIAVLGASAIRFVPWASFALLIVLKPWSTFTLRHRFLRPILLTVMIGMTLRNATLGYLSSSGPRTPRASLDKNFFPIKTLRFLKEQPLAGQLYNTHDFGSYLLWENYQPVFHHGFVTDMDFYESDVVGVFQSQARFLELARKYGWTKLLVDKHGSYRYFYNILSPLPEWKIVSEDDASYLIYYLP